MNLDIDTLRQLIREELIPLSESMRPGGEFELEGYDPDYRTSSGEKKQLSLNQQYPNCEAPVLPYETLNFTFSINMTNLALDHRIGVKLIAPSPKDGSSFEINGQQFTTFNTTVGRFKRGMLNISGVLYNGNQGGILAISFGTPEDASVNEIGEFESKEGTETIDLSAGFWLVTFNIDQDVAPETPSEDVPYQLVQIGDYSESWLLPWEGS